MTRIRRALSEKVRQRRDRGRRVKRQEIRLAARQLQNFRGNVGIVHHHVGGIEGAARLHHQKVGIRAAGPCEGDARLQSRTVQMRGQKIGQGRIQIETGSVGLRTRPIKPLRPEGTAGTPVRQKLRPVAKPSGGNGQRTGGERKLFLKHRLDPARQNRRGPLGPDGDGHGRSVDHGGRDKGGGVEIVG